MLCDQQRRYEKGQGLLELTLVLPFLLTLVLGIVQAGLAIRAYLVISNSAREGARLASRGHWFDDAQVLTVINQNLSRIRADSTYTTVVLTRAQSDPDTGTVTIQSQRTLLGAEPSRFDATGLTALHQSAVATAVAFPASTPDPTMITYLNNEEMVIVEVLHHYRVNFGLTGIDLPMYSYAIFRVSGGP
jgi:Flp pilus assembly protein TadG